MKRSRRVAGRVLAGLATHPDGNRPASVHQRLRRQEFKATVFNPSSALRESKFRLVVAGCALAASTLIRCGWWCVGCGGEFALAGSASLGGFLAACCPAVQAFAHPRRIDRRSGGIQFFRQLLAAPAFALQGEYRFAQRLQQINGGLPAFWRLSSRQLFQFLSSVG